MAAYANLVSLMNLIEHIQLYHNHHPNFLDKHQKQLESLHEKVANLKCLLEWCSLKGLIEDLESQLSYAAISAEDVIELYIVGDIHNRSLNELTMLRDHNLASVHNMDALVFSHELQKVIECMSFLADEMMKIKGKSVSEDPRLPVLQPTSSPETPLQGNNDMVGFKDEFNNIMIKLTRHGSNLKIISLIGMGGIGKSTLARNLCDNRSTTNFFDVRGWIIISQEFDVKMRMFYLLKEIKVLDGEYDEKKYDCHQLGETLYKHLSGRRFLIIVDDIWYVRDWEKLRLFFPDNSNGGRIILTSRSLKVAKEIGCSDIYNMPFLDEDTSWILLRRKAFPNETCPPKLLEIGKKIASNCKGLPLSLSVIGGLLAKLKKTRECWENIAGYINEIVNSEDDERYLKILASSYCHLPIHLKPCFLYMGIFREDHDIGINSLIDLWIAEGFLKPLEACKNLKEVAQNYLDDLIERSLIYVSKRGHTGRMKSVGIHDLLRDMALREAQKERFLHITTLNDSTYSSITESERRVGLHDASKYEIGSALSTSSSLRSLISDRYVLVPVSPGMRLLRISMNPQLLNSPEDIVHLINSRYLKILDIRGVFKLPSVQLLWNLQKISIYSRLNLEMPDTFPIWEMPLLRKLEMIGVTLPDPLLGGLGGKGDLVLNNLREIKSIMDFRCTYAVLRKISNIKELALMYVNVSENISSNYCLQNLARLRTLQKLEIWNPLKVGLCARSDQLIQNIEFPQSLVSLRLRECCFEWEHLTTKVGSLPHLKELTLKDCYTGEDWILDDEAFPCLEVLKIKRCSSLVRWTAESFHFPCLEHLFLVELENLEGIPCDIGYIATLQSIQLKDCSKSTIDSAKSILEEQRRFENNGLRILVNQKHLQDKEEGGQEDEVQEDQEKKRSKGFAVFVVPVLVILGISYAVLHNKFGGTRKVRERGEQRKEMPKKGNDERRRDAHDSWFSCYEYL